MYAKTTKHWVCCPWQVVNSGYAFVDYLLIDNIALLSTSLIDSE